MFCPQCKAEYRAGFTKCAECGVELGYELPEEAIVARESAALEFVAPGDPEGDPFCSFWLGDDPRVHAELCELLGEEGIPHKTIRRQDHLFNMNTRRAFEVGIPFSQFDKAEAAVKEAYGVDDGTVAEGMATTRELPEFVEPRESRQDWEPGNWYPEEATAEIWAGEQPEMAELLAASLGENQIHSRVAETGREYRLFVMPGDEAGAREVVREVVEGVPPE